MGELDGKVAVITGAGSGMAKAMVKVFLREGARGVIAADFNGTQETTAAELGDKVVPVHCDVRKEDDIAAMVQAAVDNFGQLDAMLSVAGIPFGKLLLDATTEDYDLIMDTMMRGPILCTQHAVRAMLKTGGGAIVNVSSGAGINAVARTSIYAAAKAGEIAITKSTAIEYGAAGIRANCIAPGPIFGEGMAANMTGKLRQSFADRVPLGRVGETNEIAEVASFLCSDRASFVNGAIVPVDGGLVASLPPHRVVDDYAPHKSES